VSTKTRGFASFPKEKHLEASSRGGKVKVPKGTATLPPEERIKRASAAGTARWVKARIDRSRGATINPKGDGRS